MNNWTWFYRPGIIFVTQLTVIKHIRKHTVLIHSMQHITVYVTAACINELIPQSSWPTTTTTTSVLQLSGLCPGLPRWAGTRTNLDFTEARDSEWQWHQPSHMQICILSQTDNHASTHHSVFYRPDAFPATQQTVSKHWRKSLWPTVHLIIIIVFIIRKYCT